MLYNRCTGIYKFGNNTYPRRIRRRFEFRSHCAGKKVRLMGWEIGQSSVTVSCVINSK